MNRLLIVLVCLLALASCGGGSRSVSGSLDDACQILRANPEFSRAFKSAERKWGVPQHVMMAIIYQESKFIANARPPVRYVAGVIPMGRLSSAYGYSQALEGTWEEYKSSTRNRSARRNNIRDASDFMGWYMNQTHKRNGVALSDARGQYLAYHEGHTGYARSTHRHKPWLVNVAKDVARRSKVYQKQLRSCRRAHRFL